MPDIEVTDADRQAADKLLTSAQEALHYAFANDGGKTELSLIIDRLIESEPREAAAKIIARAMRPERDRAERIETALRELVKVECGICRSQCPPLEDGYGVCEKLREARGALVEE